jgi:hypothetical protein
MAHSWGPKGRSCCRVSNDIIIVEIKVTPVHLFKNRLVTSHLESGFRDAYGGELS